MMTTKQKHEVEDTFYYLLNKLNESQLDYLNSLINTQLFEQNEGANLYTDKDPFGDNISE